MFKFLKQFLKLERLHCGFYLLLGHKFRIELSAGNNYAQRSGTQSVS